MKGAFSSIVGLSVAWILEQNLWYTCIYIHLAIFVFGVKGSDVLAGVYIAVLSAKAGHSFVLGSR